MDAYHRMQALGSIDGWTFEQKLYKYQKNLKAYFPTDLWLPILYNEQNETCEFGQSQTAELNFKEIHKYS